GAPGGRWASVSAAAMPTGAAEVTGRCIPGRNPRAAVWCPGTASGAGRRAGPGLHASEPVGELAEGRIERLAHLAAEVDEGEEQDVGQGEALAGDPGALEVRLQPCLAILGDGLQAGR